MKKRILSVLCMLCLLVGLVPTAAWAASGTGVNDAAGLIAAVATDGSYYLEKDITLGSTLVIDKSITLDLNGYGLALSSDAEIDAEQGSVIKITAGGKLTLNDTGSQTVTYWKKESYTDLWAEPSLTKHEGVEEITTRGGYITGGKGIYIEETGNSVRYNFGAGVYVDGGTLILNGGTIVGNGGVKGNRHCGGGVYVKNGIFTMNGGAIVGNDIDLRLDQVLTYGGGVYLDGGTFTMNDGTIRENKVDHGGGVYVGSGIFTMKGGVISKNTGLSSGGGVCVNGGTFDMQGGTISENRADGSWSYGGGVQVNKNGTFNMSAGDITGNTAEGSNSSSDTQGGGVCVWGSFKMTGGTISGNWVSGCNEGHIGGGVCVYTESANTNGTISVSGSAKIINNLKGGTKGENGEYTGAEDNNLYLNGVKIAIGGALTNEAKIGVRTDTNGFVMIIESWKTYMEGKEPTDYFTSDDKNLMVKLSANKVYLDEHEHSWAYANDGANAIKATCSVDGCPSSNGGTVTISAPSNRTYNGALKGVDLIESSWKGQEDVIYRVTYKKGDVTLDSTPEDAGTYTASLTLGSATATVTYTIAPKSVTISGLSATSRAYEKDNVRVALTGGTVDGAVSGDEVGVDLTNAVGTMQDDNVGTGKAVTVSGVALNGAKAANYELSAQPSGVTVDIAKANPTVSASVDSREYNGAALTNSDINGTNSVQGTWSWKNGNAPKTVADSTSLWTVVFTPTDSTNYNPVEKQISVTITPVELTVSGLTVENKSYDGTTAATFSGTGALNGVLGSENVTLSGTATAAFADKNVGTGKNVTFSGFTLSGTDAGNYSLTQPTATANITAKPVTISGLSATSRAYAKDNVQVALTGGTVDGAVSGDKVSVDLTNAVGTMQDANARTGKAVTVSGVALNGADAANYKLSAQPSGVTVDITKAAAPTLSDITVNIKYNVRDEQTKQVGNDMPEDAGSLTYELGESIFSGITHFTGVSVDNTGLLRYTIVQGDAGAVTTMSVIIHSTNYADATVNVKIALTAKDDVSAKISFVDGELTYTGSALTYEGATISDVSGGSWTYTYAAVTGTLDSDNKPLGAGTYTVTATYEDNDNLGSKTASLTVKQATPTGAPKYTAITSAGKTLDDAALTLTDSTITLLGTVKWVDEDGIELPGTTVVTANTAYKWLFTPTDTNYTTLSGTITPYVVTSGGGGGGGNRNPASYSVVVNDVKNGKVSVSSTAVAKGTAVTVSVTPDKGWVLESLTVTDKNGKEIELSKVSEGKYTFNMPAAKVTIKPVFKAASEEEKPAETTPAQNKFTDVPAGAYYGDAVSWAAENGITEGISATTFCPDMNCTRAQMVTFLWRAVGSPEPKAKECKFVDVDLNSYYGKAVLWAVEQGIAKGISDTTFGPDTACTRAQMVTFICRVADGKPASGTIDFNDVAIDAYYAEAIQWAVENGITNGIDENKFAPDSNCTRAAMVTFLYRYFED